MKTIQYKKAVISALNSAGFDMSKISRVSIYAGTCLCNVNITLNNDMRKFQYSTEMPDRIKFQECRDELCRDADTIRSVIENNEGIKFLGVVVSAI